MEDKNIQRNANQISLEKAAVDSEARYILRFWNPSVFTTLTTKKPQNNKPTNQTKKVEATQTQYNVLRIFNTLVIISAVYFNGYYLLLP